MLIWTINQLMHMTRDELCNLDENLRHVLAEFEVGTAQRHEVLTSLANIRSVMMQRRLNY